MTHMLKSRKQKRPITGPSVPSPDLCLLQGQPNGSVYRPLSFPNCMGGGGEEGRGSEPSSLRRKPGYLDNLLCDRIRDDFQKCRGIFSVLEMEGLHHQVGQELQVTGGSLHGQEHQHGEPVEEVMDGGPRESPMEGNPSKPSVP